MRLRWCGGLMRNRRTNVLVVWPSCAATSLCQRRSFRCVPATLHRASACTHRTVAHHACRMGLPAHPLPPDLRVPVRGHPGCRHVHRQLPEVLPDSVRCPWPRSSMLASRVHALAACVTHARVLCLVSIVRHVPGCCRYYIICTYSTVRGATDALTGVLVQCRLVAHSPH